MEEYGVDKPTLTDNFFKNAEINWNALSTRCYLSRILPNKKPKYAAANRRYRVIFDVVLTRSILKSKVWSYVDSSLLPMIKLYRMSSMLTKADTSI